MSTGCSTRLPEKFVKPRRATAADLGSGLAPFLGLGLGSGLMPFAPGTFGTLAAVPIFLLLSYGGPAIYLGGLLAIVASGVWICGQSAKVLESHDHPAIVWDEIAGFLVTMVPVDATFINVVGGFILFRFFDIIKPWPIKWADRQVGGGVGIMLDDVLAGLLAGFSLWILNTWNPAGFFLSS